MKNQSELPVVVCIKSDYTKKYEKQKMFENTEEMKDYFKAFSRDSFIAFVNKCCISETTPAIAAKFLINKCMYYNKQLA